PRPGLEHPTRGVRLHVPQVVGPYRVHAVEWRGVMEQHNEQNRFLIAGAGEHGERRVAHEPRIGVGTGASEENRAPLVAGRPHPAAAEAAADGDRTAHGTEVTSPGGARGGAAALAFSAAGPPAGGA